VVTFVLGLAWAGLLASPFVVRARRAAPAARALSLGSAAAAPPALSARWRSRLDGVGRFREMAVVRVLTAPFAHRRAALADAALTRELPVAVDLLGVAVGAGCTPYLAVEVAARWSPPTVAASLDAVVRACALGAGFGPAWHGVARRQPRLEPLAEALATGDRTGAPVGPALARLAAEERAEARRRVESQARRVPVRLLFPLVFLVLPAFVLLTVVPGLAAGLSRL
jgi:hypothetical protein